MSTAPEIVIVVAELSESYGTSRMWLCHVDEPDLSLRDLVLVCHHERARYEEEGDASCAYVCREATEEEAGAIMSKERGCPLYEEVRFGLHRDDGFRVFRKTK